MKNNILRQLDKIELFDNPWSYGICDDFIEEDVFNEMIYVCKLNNAITGNESNDREKNTKHRSINLFGYGEKGSGPKYEGVKYGDAYLIPDYIDAWNDTDTISNYLDFFSLDPRQMDDRYNIKSVESLKTIFVIRSIKPSFDSKVHTDVSRKLLSITVYLHPLSLSENHVVHSLGTNIYKSNTLMPAHHTMSGYMSEGANKNMWYENHSDSYDYAGSIEWQSNRSIIFSQMQMGTLHSFNNHVDCSYRRVALSICIVPR